MEFSTKSSLPNPMQKAGCCSKITFWWMNNLFKKGYDRRLEPNDLYEVLNQDSSERLTSRLEREWRDEVRHKQQTHLSNKKPSLFKVLFNLVKWKVIISGICGLLLQSTRLAEAYFLLFLVSYFSPESTITKLHAYLYATGLVLTVLLALFLHQAYYFLCRRAGMQLRIAVTGMIYRKVLRLSSTVQDTITSGMVMNLISTDAQKLEECLIMPHYIWVGPILIMVTAYLLWTMLGPSCFVGISFSLFMIPVQSYLGLLFGKLRLKTAVLSDQRCRLMNEIIGGIKVIKMFAWEVPYSELVQKVRRKEISKLFKSAFIKATDRGIEFASHGLMSFLMFTTYVMLGNTLDAAVVFASLSLLHRLSINMGKHFPSGIKKLSMTFVSIKRIQEFLELDELRYKGLTRSNPSKITDKFVAVNNITASWNKNCPSPTLENISFEVRKDDLLMLVGPVASGKTSLLMSILGELPLTKGDIHVRGKIAYSSQLPWIFSGTVRQNILFGQKMTESRYKRVLHACALTKDIDLMPEGDQTLVGEKGLSLSGGQKARINLARAIYYNADIYLLDDPLTAVDARVGRHLFDECLLGVLKECPTILVTHQLQFLNNATQVICLKEGKILGIGTHTELATSGIDLISLIKTKPTRDEIDGSVDSALDEDESCETTFLLAPDSPKKRSASVRSLYSRKSFSSSTNIDLELDSTIDEVHKITTDVDVEEEEERLRGTIPFRFYGRLFSAGASSCLLFVLFVLFVFTQGAYTFGDWWLAHWSDVNSQYLADLHRLSRFPSNTTDSRLLTTKYNKYFYIYVYLGVVVATLFLSVAKAILFFYVKINASRTLHDQMYDAVIRASQYFFDTNPLGRIINRFSKDIGFTDDLIPETFFEFLHLLVVSLTIVIVNVISVPWIAIGVLPLAIVFWCVRVYYLKTAREIKRLEAIGRSPVFTHFSATLEGISTIRSLSCQQVVTKELSTCQDHHTEAWFLFMSSSRWLAYRLESLCFLFVTIAAFTPLLIAEKQKIDEGVVGLALTYALILTGMFQWCVRLSAEAENQMTSVERIFEYCDLESEGSWKEPSVELPPSWPKHGIISAEKLSLQYHHSLPRALKNVFFCIRANEKVGVVGRTGAGKSSLMAALLRIAEPKGRLLIDGIDVTEIGLHDLRSRISVIPQDPVLFGGTLRRNLDPFKEYADDDLWNALNEVQLKQDISELSGGLDTNVTESGSNFSVGQRQLICLARALLRRNGILIVDEATAHVDHKTDELIQATIRQKFSNCTVLTIAHRLNTIMDADRVMVLDCGKLIEFDEPYILLLDQETLFSKLVHQTGKGNSSRLLEMARTSFDVKHQPEPMEHIPEHLRSNVEPFLQSSEIEIKMKSI